MFGDGMNRLMSMVDAHLCLISEFVGGSVVESSIEAAPDSESSLHGQDDYW